jgi:4,5-DOPA dioxygenase extradiol
LLQTFPHLLFVPEENSLMASNANLIEDSKMPALFLGHGSPMNAIEENKYTEQFRSLGKTLPVPKRILVVSAHWESSGTFLQTSEHPKTIHDFYGFPKALFEFQYPALGAGRELTLEIESLTDPHHPSPSFSGTEDWGLDHGAWSVLTHLYPNANIPVAQLSLDRNLSLPEHFRLARKLRGLREKGVLILGSGNLVHNLREIRWESDAKPHAYTVEFDELMKELILAREDEKIALIEKDHPLLTRKAHPTIEHFLPLLYVLGVSDRDEARRFPVEGLPNGSLSMRAVQIG